MIRTRSTVHMALLLNIVILHLSASGIFGLKLFRGCCMPQDSTERMSVLLSLNLQLMRNEVSTNLSVLVF
jgi:hypothetical protein